MWWVGNTPVVVIIKMDKDEEQEKKERKKWFSTKTDGRQKLQNGDMSRLRWLSS